MLTNINEIVAAITPLNNAYRDLTTSAETKMEMLWQIGDILQRMRVTKPHTLGWAVQKETKEIIKRSTVIRGYKVRAIWDSKEALLRDLGGMKFISNLFEMLPLVDPAQKVRGNLSLQQL